MYKPKLQNLELPSTAVSKNLLSSTHVPLQTTLKKSTIREFHNPMVSSFYKGPTKKEQPRFAKYQQPVLQKESKPTEQSSWVNTSDIESVIGKRIEADIQLSVEHTFKEQKYFLGPERICTQKMLPIPFEIKSILEQRRSSNEKMHMVYGYLTSLNAVYYIIEQDLYIFSINDLKIRQESKQQKSFFPERVYKPTKLRPNCQKIHEAQFPLYHSHKMIPKQFNGKVLILQYPYEIELCCYVVDNKIEKIEIPKQGQIQNIEQKNFLTLISLNVKISLETASAQFITVTQKGQLLYLNQKGQVVCFQFSKTEDNRLSRRTHRQNLDKKKTFISTNKNIVDAAKSYFWNLLDFRHSIILPRKKNLALIYDKKNNRIYTLTVRGDRTTMIQQPRKEIKIYQFVNTSISVQLNCIMLISEEEFLKQILIEPKISKDQLFTILQAQPDYNQESHLIALLSNGTKIHLYFTPETMILVHLSRCPDIDMLKHSNKQRKKNLLEISKSYMSKDQNNNIKRSFSENFQIQATKDTDLSLKSYFKNRSLSIGLIRNKDQYSMFMTLKRSFGSSNQVDVFPICWKKESIFHDVQKFPTENQIFMVESSLSQNSVNYQYTRLQKNQIEKIKAGDPDSDIKNLRPVSKDCHQLLRQVHHSPMSFVYLSNKFITNFTLLRPIDILHMMVTSRQEIFCQMYLTAIFGLEPYEISCMLLQLYTVKDGVYYKSTNYSNKINTLIDKLRQNTKKYQTLSQKSTLSKFSSSNQILTSNKQIFEQKQQDRLEVITYNQKDFEQIKPKIRRLFAFFCKQQQIKNPNAFQKIKLRFSNVTMSSQLQDKIDKLNQEQKGQAQYCLLYISRVLYPFWRAKIASSEVSRHTLHSLKQKIMQTFEVVELLRMQGNDYCSHLKIFLKKIIQIIQMCINVSQMPGSITLENAVSKEPIYFQTYMFRTIRRETSPQMLRVFIDKFPFYVSKYFETLIKIFMEARITVNLEQIKSMLGRLSEYPDYFIDFLKEQKGFKDLSFLRIRGQMVKIVTTLNIPNLPFQNLIQYLHSNVNNTQVDMEDKFMNLKQAKKRIDGYKSQQLRKIEVFSPNVLERLQKQYDELFKCLKLQQECKNEITKIAFWAYDQNKPDQGKQNGGFFSNLLSKVSFLSSKTTETQKPSNQKRLSLLTNKQDTKKIELQNQNIFRKLNYYALPREDLRLLILQIKSPRLLILHYSMFSGRGISGAQKQDFKLRLYSYYCDIVNEGIKKYNIRMSFVVNTKQNFSKFLDYIRVEVRQIFLFLNMTKTPLFFSPLYQGIKKQMIKIDATLKFIIENAQQCIYSVGRELVQLGFDKNLVLSHINYESINRNFCAQEFQGQVDSEYCLKNWIYDWYMAVDVAKKYRKSQDLNILHRLAKDILESKKNFLAQRVDYKEFLQKGIQTIFNIINGNHENQMERKDIMSRMMNSFK